MFPSFLGAEPTSDKHSSLFSKVHLLANRMINYVITFNKKT